MKKNILILALAAAFASTALADVGNSEVGIFSSGIELSASGAGATSPGTTMYQLNQGDPDGVIMPTGSTATLSLAWTGSSTGDAATFNLGTFAPGSSLTLTGGSLLTYSNSGASSTPGQQDLNYQIQDATLGYYSGFTPVNLSFDATGASVDGSGNTRFATEALSTNLLAGLAPGTYSINLYFSSGYSDPLATPTSGTFFDSNGGLNYGATFTVAAAPEPSTWAMMGSGFALLFCIQHFRRKKAA